VIDTRLALVDIGPSTNVSSHTKQPAFAHCSCWVAPSVLSGCPPCCV